MPKKKPVEKLRVPWWSNELEVLKRGVTISKRRIRSAAPRFRGGAIEQYLRAKEAYEAKAKSAQISSWKEFCAKQTREGMWEGIYRVIRNTKRREEDLPLVSNGVQLGSKESVELLARTFYPSDRVEDDDASHSRIRLMAESIRSPNNVTHEPDFTEVELRSAVADFNPRKAPGGDGLTADICAQVILEDTKTYLAIINKCWQLEHFPGDWKEAVVVVLRQPGKDDYRHPKSYRPIGLLPLLGKIYEKMLVKRLTHHLVPRLSSRQYGFMPQRSTEDALYELVTHVRSKLHEKKLITMVSLDIEGAFDSAWWPAIKVRLAEEQCPERLRGTMASYLKDRSVKVRYAGREHVQKTSMGCVQGSIGGPVLWNLLLNPLLNDLTGRGIHCQAFADDIVLTFSGDDAEEVQRQGNSTLEHVQRWGVANRLRFAPHKTLAMVLTKKLKYDAPRLSMGGVGIALSKEIKILGLTIDSGLTFNAHAANVCRRALEVYKQLSRAARVSWGLHPEVVSTIYTAAVEPIITYAASAWAQATKKKCVTKHLNTVQRLFAQRKIKAYRTVSLNAALVLAGILPLDIRIRENASLYAVRRELQPPIPDREIETPMPYVNRPHPALHMDHGFLMLENEQEVQNRVDSAIQIFTDGSKIEGKVGAALSVWRGPTEIQNTKLNLPSYCTVYQAELLAICEAARVAAQVYSESCAILSDSRAALETVTNNNSTHRLALRTRAYIQEMKAQQKTIELLWIKAHAGIAGNERADQLAKEAALRTKKKPLYDKCPISYAKREIRKIALTEWNARYKEGTTASVTKLFLPDAIDAYKIVKKIGIEQTRTQALTGHGGYAAYLHRFHCKSSPSCACDPDIEESVPHLLFDCPIHSNSRCDAENKLDMQILPGTIVELMTRTKTRDILLDFCDEITKKANKRNK